MRIVKFVGSNGDWYWKMVARNGESIAVGGEGYRNERDLNRTLNLIRANIAIAPVKKATGILGEIDDDAFAAKPCALGLLGSR